MVTDGLISAGSMMPKQPARRPTGTRSRDGLAPYRNSAAVNHLQLRYPSTWQLGAPRTVVPGMSFDSPLVLTRTDGAHGLTAGTVADADCAGGVDRCCGVCANPVCGGDSKSAAVTTRTAAFIMVVSPYSSPRAFADPLKKRADQS